MDTRTPGAARPACQAHHPNCPRANLFGGVATQQQRPAPRTAAKPAAGQTAAYAENQPAENRPATAHANRAGCPRRAHLCAYASDYVLEHGAAVPLEEQRADGRLAMLEGVAHLPEDGYYMILWEIGVAQAEGPAALHLKINDAAVPLVHRLAPGYESGQQVTWLSAGDKLCLCAEAPAAAGEPARVTCGNTELTIVRLG
jgi:hypothetical protein